VTWVFLPRRRVVAGGGGATNPNWANVTLQVLGNNPPSSTLIDTSLLANTITNNNSPSNSSAQSLEGGGSVFFNGGGLEIASGLASAWDFAGGDFFIRAVIYGTAGGTDRHIFDAWSSRFLLRHSGTDVQFFTNFAGVLLSFSQAWNTGSWVEYGVGRQGNDWGIWYGGVSKATTTNAGTISSTAIRLRISTGNAGDTVPGYGDGIEIYKGVCPYTPGVNYTPPTIFPSA
jgi:hypothetical protein